MVFDTYSLLLLLAIGLLSYLLGHLLGYLYGRGQILGADRNSQRTEQKGPRA
jgi:hypothetical protein